MSDYRLLIDATAAAELLSLAPRSLYQLAQERRIPCVRIGRRLRFEPDRLREWIRENREVPE